MTKLEDYASEPGKSAMDLVLFRYRQQTLRRLCLQAYIKPVTACQLTYCTC